MLIEEPLIEVPEIEPPLIVLPEIVEPEIEPPLILEPEIVEADILPCIVALEAYKLPSCPTRNGALPLSFTPAPAQKA